MNLFIGSRRRIVPNQDASHQDLVVLHDPKSDIVNAPVVIEECL